MAAVSKAPNRVARFLRNLTGSMEMPHEVVLDVPKATLIGDLQIHIENHKGVLEYTPGRIVVRTTNGRFVVVGSRLKIGSIFQDEIVIEGRIHRVDLAPSEGSGEGAVP